MSNISLTTLGGVRENGKNMYIAEIGESIFVLNVGLKYPENEQLGVDVVIPKMDYLFENKDRIAGVFLTHGHADAIGALPYLLAEAKVPVFGSELTIELAKLFVKGNDAVKEFNDFHVIDENTEIDFGGTVVSFFPTTYSVPESLGIVLKTAEGSIVYTGDFKFDQTASESYATDFARLAEIGRDGVLALLSDSANAAIFRWLVKVKLGMKLPKPLLTGKVASSLQLFPVTFLVSSRFLTLRIKQVDVSS